MHTENYLEAAHALILSIESCQSSYKTYHHLTHMKINIQMVYGNFKLLAVLD